MGQVVEFRLQVADAMTPALVNVERAATKAAASTAVVEHATKSFNRSSNTAAMGAKNLAFQLNDVATMAALGAQPMQILASQGGQVAQALSDMGVSLGTMLRVLGPVAIAAAGLTFVYKGLEAQLEKVNEKNERAAALATKTADAWRSMRSAGEDLDTKIGLATGTLQQWEVDAKGQVQTYREQRKAQEELLRAEAEAAKGRVGYALAYVEARDALAAYREETEDGVSTIRALAKAEYDNEQATRRAAAAAAAAAESRRIVMEQQREEAAKVAAQWRIALDAASSKAREAERIMAEFSAAVEAAVPREALTAQEQLYQLQASIGDEFARGRISAIDYARAIDEIAAAQQRLDEEAKTFGVTSATNVVKTASEGPGGVLSAVSSAGPVGALIAAILELIGNFKKLGESLHDLWTGFVNSIKELPTTIAEALPGALDTAEQAAGPMISGFVRGLVANLPTIIEALITSLLGELPRLVVELTLFLANPMTWLGLVGAIIKGIVMSLASLFENVGSYGERGGAAFEGPYAFGSYEPTVFDSEWWSGDSYDVGGIVRRTGLAMVHKNEVITRSDGTGPQSSGGGGTIQVVMQGGGPFSAAEVNRLVRAVNQHLGSGGRGLSWAS
jgi:hypothetical protein